MNADRRDNHQQHAKPLGPRLYHKKSRAGCLRCKARRVKCDEKRPACTGCSRHLVECVYPTNRGKSPRKRGGSSSEPEASSSSSSAALNVLQANHHQRGLPPSYTTTSINSSSHNVETPDPSVSPGLSFAAAPSPLPITAHPPSPGLSAPQAPSPTITLNPPSPHHNQSSSFPALSNTNTPSAHASSASPPFTEDIITDPPESKERRMWELRLLHNYVEMIATVRPPPPGTSFTSSPSPGPAVQFFFGREIPLMAFEPGHESILYAMLAYSALNLWTRCPPGDSPEKGRLWVLQQTYLGMALREQRKIVSSQALTPDNADYLCMSSLTIMSHAFASVQTTTLCHHHHHHQEEGSEEAWQPPLEWLKIGRGTGGVFMAARRLLPSSSNGRITRFLNSPPRFDPDDIFRESNRADLMWLLDSPEGEGEGEGWGGKDSESSSRGGEDDDVAGGEEDKITMAIYRRVLSYVGWVRNAIRVGEAEFVTQRRLAAFSVWIPDIFHDFLQQRRPRALVCLAWFFSLWIRYDHLWTINGAGKRQVLGIYHHALENAPRWKTKLDPILQEYGLR
ncbi:hypothetical protein QBC46DRAFT_425094 [Diplogelasinospora grovesii]|uniref:Zn(2)-C6 fungal-type domain-containing protein n=1 Tax=Diplogelasinospora grovesii TaxID=303347 RepID=A0AAN6NID0_9PEZI|nr:hypothetical protein QBC46DRAFT_425094 [Diplogelasinospora grovesii]